MNEPNKIAQIIISLTKSRGMSVHQMLKICGLTPSVVDRMRTGSMPSADKLSLIAQFLNVSTDFLLGHTDDPTPPGSDPIDSKTLKFALAKGAEVEFEEITDEVFNEVLQYAKFVAQRNKLQQNSGTS